MDVRLNRMIQIGAFLGGVAVMIGAFGAHYLGDLLSERDKEVFEIAVRYHYYHVFAILLTSAIYAHDDRKGLKWTFRFFLVGILIFCGSVYLLSTSTIIFGTRLSWLGAITPIGGVFFMLGWFSLFLSFFRKK